MAPLFLRSGWLLPTSLQDADEVHAGKPIESTRRKREEGPMGRIIELLEDRAIVGSKGHITNFALIIVAIVFIVALVKIPKVTLGSTLVSGVVRSVTRVLSKN